MVMNLKGFIVGNGVTDFDVEYWPSYPDVVKYFNLIPESTYKKWNDAGCIYFTNLTWTDDQKCPEIF